MAVLQMQRIFIYALKKDRKAILELLQRRGVVEIGDILREDSVFHKMDVSAARTGFERNISTAKEAIDVLQRYVPAKKSMLSSLSGRKELPLEVYESFKDKYEVTVQIANRVLNLSKSITESKAEILKLETQAEILYPWTLLDIPLSFSGTKYTKGYIGTLPKAWSLEEIYEKLADSMPVDVDVISSTKEQTCIFVLCTREKADSVYDTLRGMEFSLTGNTSDQSPSDQLDIINRQLSDIESSIRKAQEEIEILADYREDLFFLQDYDTMRADKYEVINHLLQSKNVFIISGFIPEKDGEALSEELNKNFDLAVELEEPRKKDDVPVLLKNNVLSSPLEGTLAAFSPPGKGEIDPTTVMSIFYYVLFGLMLSDAGYGAMMVIACGVLLLKYRRTMEGSMKKSLTMFLLCGTSTLFWGIMFGSYFGDLIDVTTAKFFGDKVSVSPVWFFPTVEPMRMLAFSMLMGIIHLFAGLGMKLYSCIKNKDYKAALYDVGFWYIMLTSLVILLLSMDMVTDIIMVEINFPPIVLSAAKILALLSALGVILTNGRESRNPFKRVLKGLYALYGVSGYLGDVLSYSRLLALGLATGVICTVINQMAAMAPNGFFGAIFFTIIIIVGHLLNFGINVLGAYVHTSRLQYVEFFGKFYEGGGRLFAPFKMNTKYYKFKEKINYGNVK